MFFRLIRYLASRVHCLFSYRFKRPDVIRVVLKTTNVIETSEWTVWAKPFYCQLLLMVCEYKILHCICVAARQNPQDGVCAKRRLRSAWASAQYDQSLVSARRNLSYPLSTQRRLWSDWADAQAGLRLRWAHVSLSWFWRAASHIENNIVNQVKELVDIKYCVLKVSEYICVHCIFSIER